jgi:hypothetical protein
LRTQGHARAANLTTGERKPIQMKVPGVGGGRGGFGGSSFSPDNSDYVYSELGEYPA